LGNRIYPPIHRYQDQIVAHNFRRRVEALATDAQWGHLANIHNIIFNSVSKFFHEIGALFVLLPLTTRMISSPGALYGRNKISYTTDTSPISLNWFDLPNLAFLSESSQIYLELALLQGNVRQVFSIYNSFRKEIADSTHLSEFHHIEYEGHVSEEEN